MQFTFHTDLFWFKKGTKTWIWSNGLLFITLTIFLNWVITSLLLYPGCACICFLKWRLEVSVLLFLFITWTVSPFVFLNFILCMHHHCCICPIFIFIVANKSPLKRSKGGNYFIVRETRKVPLLGGIIIILLSTYFFRSGGGQSIGIAKGSLWLLSQLSPHATNQQQATKLGDMLLLFLQPRSRLDEGMDIVCINGLLCTFPFYHKHFKHWFLREI